MGGKIRFRNVLSGKAHIQQTKQKEFHYFIFSFYGIKKQNCNAK